MYVGDDGKLYFTPKAIQFYVPKSLVSIGKLEEVLWPGINLFGMPCIDGRYKFPDNFDELPLAEKLKINSGAIPWGWAGMLMTLVASLRKIFSEEDPNHILYIKEALTVLLEKNKKENPDNYKIKRHSDLHPKDTDGFVCGCWFLCNAKKDPESYGITPEMMNMIVGILENPDWSESPVVLWEWHKHLELHKERAAIVLNNIDDNSRYENFIMKKQIDFSDMLTKDELESLSDDEKQELNQMVFTVNFRSFPILVSEAASAVVEYLVQDSNLIEKVIISEKDRIKLARDHNSYFNIDKSRVTAWDAVLALLKTNIQSLIQNSTGHIKQKLSGAPLVTVDFTQDGMYEINTVFEN